MLSFPESSTDVFPPVKAVLQKAVNEKVLMFCSAPDKGKFTEHDYPSGPWRNEFFRIGAAHANSTVFEWTPEDGITYICPGVDVAQNQAQASSSRTTLAGSVTSCIKELKQETGSSVATALAAGLAAMIIYCVQASILTVLMANQNKSSINPVPNDLATLVADPDAMKDAFSRLGKVTPNRFIQVWDELDKISKIMETRGPSSGPKRDLVCATKFMDFGLKLTSSVKRWM